MKEILKSKSFLICAGVVLLLVMLAVCVNWQGNLVTEIYTQPYMAMGKAIRAVGAKSNFLAFAMYIIFCILPLVYPAVRFAKSKKWHSVDIIWAFLTLLTFVFMYFAINPHKLDATIMREFADNFAEMQSVMLTGLILTLWGVLIIGILTELYLKQKAQSSKIFGYAKVLLVFLAALILIESFFINTIELKSILKKILEKDVLQVISNFNVPLNVFVHVLTYLIAATPAVFSVALCFKVLKLVSSLKADFFATENIPLLKDVVKISGSTAYITILSTVIINLIYFVFSGNLLFINFKLSIPIVILIACCFALIFAKILIRAIEINEENKLVI